MTARKSALPFYAAAVVWLAYACFLPLYQPVHFVLAAMASLIAFLTAALLCRGAAIGAAAAAEAKKEETPKKEEASTGNADLDKMLKDGQLAVAEMKRLDDSIADPEISADIVRLEEISGKIFQLVREDPSKLPQIRKFMSFLNCLADLLTRLTIQISETPS